MDTKYEYRKYLEDKLGGDDHVLDIAKLAEVLADFEWRISAVEATANRLEPE